MTDIQRESAQIVKDFFGLDPDTLRRGSEVIKTLNRAGSVSYIPELNFYAVTGYDAVCNVARRPKEFSSHNVTGRVVKDGYPHALLNADPPEHTRQKMFVAKAFAPNVVRQREERMRELVNEVIDDFMDKGRFRVVQDFAFLFPVVTSAELLGVPRENRETFLEWARATVAPIGNPKLTRDEHKALSVHYDDFEDYFLKVIRERREEPADDFISLMLEKSDDGAVPLSDGEMIVILRQLMTGGILTTAKLITSVFELLFANPDQLAAVRADPDLIPGLLDETLRIKAPVHGMFRTTTTDADVDGVTIPEGSMVWLVFSSGGTDERVFECPEKFDIHRPNARKHLSFGVGPHRCVGFGLASTQARIALEEIFRRVGEIRLAPDNTFEPISSFVLQGLSELIVEFDPA
jgi:cytochrome P450